MEIALKRENNNKRLCCILACLVRGFFYRLLLPSAFGEPTWAVISLFTASFFSLPEECE